MNVFVINGSSKANGNTAASLDAVCEVLQEQGIACERLDIGSTALHGCIGCMTCRTRRNRRCVFDDDGVNDWLDAMFRADGVLIGTPVYYAGLNGALKCILDRAFFVAGANGGLFRHKVGAAVAAVRRAGGVPSLDQIGKYFTISEMFVPSSNYWNMVYGMQPGEAVQDIEGIQSARVLGANMAWLLKLIEHGREAVPPPARVEKTPMNFIRP